jgi:hypothetical protein
MNAPSCLHEADVLDLVATDQWPARAAEALRAHVGGCRVCADLATVAAAFAAVVDRMQHSGTLPVL